MAARTPIPSPSLSLLPTRGGITATATTVSWLTPATRSGSRSVLRVYAAAAAGGEGGRQRPPPDVDTRIHWENEDEGWVGGSSSSGTTTQQSVEEEQKKNLLGEKFSELLNKSTDSHYQFLGVAAEADLEEIKAAYRRLSKEYHPDTTSLPLKAASEMFLKLREVYDVLSDPEKRRFYDWTLAQEAASREAEKMRVKLEDPYMKDIENFESIPDMVDRLGGRNMELSDQAKSALTFDIFIILFSIGCILYVVLFQEPYY
ncbi:putative DnaJ domain, Chaperone J-domain superfamily [Helianthus annuus]|uniref:DnaJ domain, Chaperone J-domain superfamily n=1 Tax=Helianthus annuus TaxID=4232 RepID=A0A251SR26_HELAN|nr:NAD(P)H-quinone oxidoreductase subunit T, chloroplastic [Helianthus annuus]KAF5773142.1 putative DnaJ domain, Chaperone J-domain superfamily [Helianthus annuus]KAJ0480956.1 putative DnaJ domain, Chaperone J-domain superfamily [Helianthus annuus]KAJ0497487.1 putative DnaJ domain, Chaperone J-domain superfamily, NAD(P)H-quinone oxidoreductase subunit T [Helianthus annuus]KAJ0663504.1 putative DnaJ domain, Chaperone J-domain superfamily, NAD(P)H-quinone oxidoreductase subunit T [Helianthus annu